MIKFQKLNNNINPILEPKLSSFICPVLKKQVLWEEKDVFNPAAVVKDNLVYLLYRAEDRVNYFNFIFLFFFILIFNFY